MATLTVTLKTRGGGRAGLKVAPQPRRDVPCYTVWRCGWLNKTSTFTDVYHFFIRCIF